MVCRYMYKKNNYNKITIFLLFVVFGQDEMPGLTMTVVLALPLHVPDLLLHLRQP